MLRQIELGRETDAPRRVVLNPAPTPLLPTPELAKALGGPALWMKRDDLIPFGLGGNKIGGLELILADADGAHDVVQDACVKALANLPPNTGW